MGEPLVISGENFGGERGESFVTIAGVQPTGLSYFSWRDGEIVIRTPEFGDSGLVYVYVDGKKSNGALFSNSAKLPKRTQEGETGFGPKIISVKPQNGPIGSLVTITGTGFGTSRDSGGVFFSWNADPPLSAPSGARFQEFIEVSEAESGYEMWSEREIQVRVPDGATGGNMEIRTARGGSPPLFFTVSDKPGTKNFRDKRIYTLTTSVNIKPGEAETPNSLFLWVPRPAPSSSQRNIELLQSNPQPFMEDYRGTGIYKLEDLTKNSERQVSVSWKVEVYRVETSLRPQQIRQESQSPVNGTYTRSNALIPSDDPRIKEAAARITGRERNPYLKAKMIYEWMTGEVAIKEGRLETDLFSVPETKEADSYTAALLYCALLRAAGVPCLPVAGVLVNRNFATVNHYWAEFRVDGFGWIPVDPAMGSGVPASFQTPPEQSPDSPSGPAVPDFYFGNIDSRRIAFSRGFADLSPMTPGSRTVTLNRSYSLQNLWEEATGNLESYTSLWGDVMITGIYAQ